jgi:hypothetical protein
MAKKGRVQRITHTTTAEDEKDFQNLAIEGIKTTTATPKERGESSNDGK